LVGGALALLFGGAAGEEVPGFASLAKNPLPSLFDPEVAAGGAGGEPVGLGALAGPVAGVMPCAACM
jgi:hypothetical protein